MSSSTGGATRYVVGKCTDAGSNPAPGTNIKIKQNEYGKFYKRKK